MNAKNTSLTEPTTAYPHNGKLLQGYLTSHNIRIVDLARGMKVASPTVFQYFNSQSLQLNIWWKISQALNHNFLAELAEQLPVEHITAREKELQNQIDALQKELEKTNIELSVYKNIMGK